MAPSGRQAAVPVTSLLRQLSGAKLTTHRGCLDSGSWHDRPSSRRSAYQRETYEDGGILKSTVDAQKCDGHHILDLKSVPCVRCQHAVSEEDLNVQLILRFKRPGPRAPGRDIRNGI